MRPKQLTGRHLHGCSPLLLLHRRKPNVTTDAKNGAMPDFLPWLYYITYFFPFQYFCKILKCNLKMAEFIGKIKLAEKC